MRNQRLTLAMTGLAGLSLLIAAARSDLNDSYEKVTQAAVKKVSPSVVRIETQGGTDIVKVGPKGAAFRKNLGPTTGVIISADGYIISSAFNFINNPSNILIEIQGDKKSPYKATKVATDRARMLTLLKIDAQNLPVPAFVAKKDLKVGSTSLALGRTLDTVQTSPSVSFGVVSALNRVWGKCVQTDAKTSPINYGGPLIDVQGRVQGIIIPASPRGDDATAGFEWYDSGIGFAVPMEDVLAVLPRLKKGQDLKPGLLGVNFQSQDMFGGNLVISNVAPETAAAKAGLKAGDKLTEVDGTKVETLAQIKHVLGTKYEGDSIALKYDRGGKETTIAQLDLVGKLKVIANSFLGILPVRDDPKLGVEIRYVYPKSPADLAGLKVGDRIMKFGTDKLDDFKGKVRGKNELLAFLNGQKPGAEIKLEVAAKGGKTAPVTLKLAEFPGLSAESKDAILKDAPPRASLKKALEPLEPGPGQPKPAPGPAKKPEPEKGLVKLTAANGNHTYYVYVHGEYDPNISHAVVVWLHPPEKSAEKDFETFAATWEKFCEEQNILLVFPVGASVDGWTPSDGPKVQEVIRDVLPRYSIDSQRVVAHGLGIGGQMAIHLGFTARDLVHGVATTGSVPTKPEDNNPAQRVAFFLAAGDRDPLVKAISGSQTKLMEHKIPSLYLEMKGVGRQYLDAQTLEDLVKWIDALDRM